MSPLRTPESAEITGLKALGFLVDSEAAMDRFMALSGLAPDELKIRAGEPEFLGAVLDFVLADDSLLLAFCESEGLKPEAVHRARARLPGGAVA